MSININLLSEHFQEVMKQHSENMKSIAEPLRNFQSLPVFEELQENMQELSKLTKGVALKNQEAFELIANLNNHPGLKALSEQMELMSRELTAKLSIDLVSPVLKDLQSSLNGPEISEDKFVRALEKLEKRDFVEEFENTVSNIEKGHSTAQGVRIGISEVLALLMFILMLIQTIDNSTQKELSDEQELTNKLLQSLVSNTDELINKSKNESLKLLIVNEPVPLRSQPAINSDTLITLFKGQHLDLLKVKGNWYKVQYYDSSASENGIGWIQKKHIIPEIGLEQVQTKRLGDIATSSKGKKPDLIKNESDEGLIPYVDIQGFEDRVFRKYTDGKDCRLCEEGDLLIVWDGSRSGLVGKAPAGAIGSTLAKIEIDGVIDDYGYYFLKSQYQYLNTNPKGSGTPHVDPDLLWDLEIKVPPIETQHRIVEKIEELFSDLDNGISTLKKVRQQLETYKQSVLKAAFGGKITKKWREQQEDLPTPEELKTRIEEERKRYWEQQFEEWRQEVKDWEGAGEPGKKPRKPRFKKSIQTFPKVEKNRLPNLPDSWEWMKVGNITTEVQVGPFGSLLHKSDYIKNGIPVINPTNISHPKIKPNSNQTITKEKFNSLTKYELREGNIILGRRGEMGRCALVTDKEDGWLCGTGSIAVRFTDSINSKFANRYFNSKTAVDYLENNATGTTMKNLNQEIVRNLPFPVFSIEEQNFILEQLELNLSIITEVQKTINKELQKAEGLRQSILKKAFAGKLIN